MTSALDDRRTGTSEADVSRTEGGETQPGSVLGLLGRVTINRLYQQLAMFFILVLTARWLGPDGRGFLASAVAWVQLAGTAAGLSLGKVAFERCGLGGRSWDARLVIAMIALSSAALMVLLAVGASAVALTGTSGFGQEAYAIYAFIALSIPFYIWEDFAFYLLTSRSRITQNFRIVSVGRTCSVALVVLLVAVCELGISGALIAVFVGQATSSLWTFCLVWNGLSGAKNGTDKETVASLFRKSLKLHPQTLAMILFGTSDVILLHAFRGEAEAAFYQAAWALIAIPVFASTPVANVMYQLIAERGPDGAWAVQRKLLIISLGAAAAMSILAVWLAPLAIPLVFGSAFQPSSAIFLGLIPFGIARVLTNLMTPQWIGRGLFAQFSTATVAIAIVTLALNVVLIPEYGTWGAVQVSWIATIGLVAVNLGLVVWISVWSGSANPSDGVSSR